MDKSSMEKASLRDKVGELATLSRELEQLTRQMAAATNQLQAGFLKDRVDQLQAKQRQLVRQIADQCSDAAIKERFDGLDRRLETLRESVQESKQKDELDRLRAEIDPLVDEWAQVFQEMVVQMLSPSSQQPPV